MHRKNLKLSIVKLLFMSIILALPSNAIATPSSKRSKISRLKNQVDSIDRQVSIVDEEYLQASLGLKKINFKIQTNAQSLSNTQKKLNNSKKILSKRVRAMYKQDDSSSLDFILSTETFNEFLTNWDYINRISDSDKSLIVKVSNIKTEIEQTRKKLKSNLKYQASTVKTISNKKRRIESELQRKKRLIGSLETDLRTYERTQESRELRSAENQKNSYSSPVPISPPTNAPRSSVVQIAMRYLGRPYRWGAAGPNAFDCSGFTMYVYAQVGVGLSHSS